MNASQLEDIIDDWEELILHMTEALYDTYVKLFNFTGFVSSMVVIP